MPRKKSCLSRNTRDARRRALSRAAETPEQRAQRLEKHRIQSSQRRKLETIEQRLARNEKDRIRSARKRNSQRQHQRSLQLKRVLELLEFGNEQQSKKVCNNKQKRKTKPRQIIKVNINEIEEIDTTFIKVEPVEEENNVGIRNVGCQTNLPRGRKAESFEFDSGCLNGNEVYTQCYLYRELGVHMQVEND